MRRPCSQVFKQVHCSFIRSYSNTTGLKSPIIDIQNATFYRQHPSSVSTLHPPIFPNLTFSLPSSSPQEEHWAIISPAQTCRTAFIKILQGHYFSSPPEARQYPWLNSNDERIVKNPRLRDPRNAIQYIGFGAGSNKISGSGTRGAHLSARYESRREETDFSLSDYLTGHTKLNPSENERLLEEEMGNGGIMNQAVQELGLNALLDLPVGNLSNGQKKRAILAKALLGSPELLLIDQMFAGIDVYNVDMLSQFLQRRADLQIPRVILSSHSMDGLPSWITHVVHLDSHFSVLYIGPKQDTTRSLEEKTLQSFLIKYPETIPELEDSETGNAELGDFRTLTNWNVCFMNDPNLKNGRHCEPTARQLKFLHSWTPNSTSIPIGEPVVEMEGIQIKYGEKQVLGFGKQMVGVESKDGLWWTVRRGERWGVFGPNGSGKTTLLSLICSDHPQTYSNPIKLFGQSRLPSLGRPGISIFDIQARIGQSSPEIHAFFSQKLTVRQTLENAWADTLLGKPLLNHERDQIVDACLRWFKKELDINMNETDVFWPDKLVFGSPKNERSSVLRRHDVYEEYISTDVDWADGTCFGDLSFSSQRVALFIRAIIKKPDIVILDEAFAGMDLATCEKCMSFLAHGETVWRKPDARTVDARGKPVANKWDTALGVQGLNLRLKFPHTWVETILQDNSRSTISGLEDRQALICVSHVKDEVPPLVNRWLKLPDPREREEVRIGTIDRKDKEWWKWWNTVWSRERR